MANTFRSSQNAIMQKMVVCLEISLSKNFYQKETSQLIWVTSQLTGFYILRFFTETDFRTDINSILLVI